MSTHFQASAKRPRPCTFATAIAFSLTAGVFLLANGPARAADVAIRPGDQVVRVIVQTPAQLQAMEAMDLDIWSHEYGVGPLDVHVSPTQLQALNNLGLTFEVLIDDLVAAYERERGGPEGGGTWTAYMDLPTIIAFINNLAAQRPDLCQVIDIGDTIENREIWAIRITGATPGPKPGVLYHGLQHCREWITGPMVLYLANHLVTNYDTDPCIQDLVDRTEIFIVPVMNPDGYAYTWIDSNTRLWRKNRRNNGDGTFGVDLNRNWAYGWGGGGSSGTPSSETYRGTAPFSEPETTAMSNFITAHPNITCHMDYHSYSQLVMWPFGTVCTPPPEPDATLFDVLGSAMRDLIYDVHREVYVDGPICPTLYQASGASVDWVYATAGRTSLTIELRPTASPGFLLPPDQILPVCQENLEAILHETRWASSGVVIGPIGGAPRFIAGQPTVVNCTIVPRLEGLMAGSGMLHYRTGGTGPFTTVALNDLGSYAYSATIPAQTCGATVQYYFSASGNAGFQAALPCGGAEAPFIGKVVELAFGDNFETSQGWTTAVNGATAGFWERGVPVNDPNWSWDPATDADGSGQCYLTQNALGNTDVDNGSVILTSPAIDMTGGDVLIEYAYYLALSNQTGGVDRLLVEINTNNGVGPWTQIALHATTYNWVPWRWVSIDHAALNAAGVTPSATTRLRFTANDANPQSNVEAGVDALSVYVHCAAACPTLLGDMNGDSVLNGRDITGFVDANLLPPNYHPCADMAAPTGTLDASDLSAFVAALIGS